LTGRGSTGPLVVIRTVMRVAGISNISILVGEAEFVHALDSCRAGRRPSPWELPAATLG
jgi:hypothetical protein